jgi:Domain of unknown function (DUF3291)
LETEGMNDGATNGADERVSAAEPASPWQLAQINIARLVAAQGDARVQPFFDALDAVNAVADLSPGFIWRLQSETGNATDIQPTPDPLLVINMSVWRDVDALSGFAYRSAHAPVMAQRRDFFETFDGAYLALWWVSAGHQPTVDEGLARLWMLDQYGPSPLAFTLKSRFAPPSVLTTN